jgi:hypothetical protein
MLIQAYLLTLLLTHFYSGETVPLKADCKLNMSAPAKLLFKKNHARNISSQTSAGKDDILITLFGKLNIKKEVLNPL